MAMLARACRWTWTRRAGAALLCLACRKPTTEASPTGLDAGALPDAGRLPVVEPDASAMAPRVEPLRVIGMSELPTDVRVAGKLAKAVRWNDANGDNFVTFAIRWVRGFDEHDPVQNVYLTVEHAAYRDGRKKVLRVVTDRREVCGSEMTASFLDDILELTDLDADGYSEITFAYRVTCNDSSANWFQKLLVLENGDQYALRSRGRRSSNGRAIEDVDSSLTAAPADFLEHCRASWQKIPPPPTRPFE